MIKTATISPNQLYRYTLRRVWDTSKPLVMFIGLNPSTADEHEDDPTIRRCIGFARGWGFGGLIMVNLFAFRCTSPYNLPPKASNPVGSLNDYHIRRCYNDAALTIAAWGNGDVLKRLGHDRPQFIRDNFKPLYCLTVNKDGQPGHPLYLKKSLLPIPFE